MTLMNEFGTKEFIENELNRAGIFFRPLRGDFAISCPFHVHSGKKQLLRIRYSDGWLHCWSCNKAGPWSDLADTLGMQKLPESSNASFSSDERLAKTLEQFKGKPSIPKDCKPFDRDFRGYSKEFLLSFDSKLWYDPDCKVERILWPITYNKRLQGWVSRRTDGGDHMRYRNGPDRVFSAKTSMWPLDADIVQKSKTIILVEGPFSALALLKHGLPAVSILGTGTWNSNKLQLLQLRELPVKRILIALDGDEPGWITANRILRDAQDRFERVELFEFPENKDPDNCSSKTLERLLNDFNHLNAQQGSEQIELR